MYNDILTDLQVYSKKTPTLAGVILGVLKYAGFRASFLYRVGHRCYRSGHRIFAAIIVRLIRATCSMDIEVACEIGPGVCFPHTFGVVIGGKVKIGSNCKIMQGVSFGGSLGKTTEDGRTQPVVGNNVFFGAGAKVIGPVKIGSGAIIGANSVVVKDIPANAKAFGVPAKIIAIRDDIIADA